MISTKIVRALRPRRTRGLAAGVLLLAGAALLTEPGATAQYSTVELTNSSDFHIGSQDRFGNPIATDGTYFAFSTWNALYSREIGGGGRKLLFAAGDTLPRSGVKAGIIYPQVVIDNGTVVFLAAENPNDSSSLFGLYAIKADGSAPAERVFDSTIVSSSENWSADMDKYAYSWIFQESHGVAVIALQGVLYSANLDGSDVKTLWQANPPNFAGCPSQGDYHQIFTVTQATLPATNGTHYTFDGSSILGFVGVYQGPLTEVDACGNPINSQITLDDASTKPVITLPGQPVKAGPFQFQNTGQVIQIDGDDVYFGASVAEGVSATENYTGYFRVPLAGGKAEAIVTNISHVPGIVNAKGEYDQVWLLGFAVKNGKFVFLAQDATPGNPGVASFYMVDGSKYVTLFSSGSSVSNQCAGALDAEYAAPGVLNQVSLSSSGLLAFVAETLPAYVPDENGPCSYAQGQYIDDPISYYLLDTTHPLIPSQTETSLTLSSPLTFGEKPSLKIKVSPAEDSKNPRHLVPTGIVSVWFTNPEYFGAQQPHSPTATLNSDGEATIPLGALDVGTYTYTVSYGGDENFSSSASAGLTFPLHVTAPTFSVKGGTYSSAQSVTIADSTPGSTIYYTTDGSAPTTKSKAYESPLTVSANETIKAMAAATGDAQSSVTAEVYTIK
jgi:hypothetical protein